MPDLFEVVLRRAQQCLERTPTIILGSGASAGYGVPGMGALRKHLLESIASSEFETDEAAAWERFSEILKVHDLESSLQLFPLVGRPLSRVVEETWRLISNADHEVFLQLVRDPYALALRRLYDHLFDSIHRTLSVITTNYDRLAEYAADAGGYGHQTGFSYGYLRYESTTTPWSLRKNGGAARVVDVWKVHGSLDWFRQPGGSIVGLPSVNQIPTDMAPAIVTPGGAKYRAALQDPFRTIITNADQALMRAGAYLCIGYGFNDEHIQPKLVDRVRRDAVPLVIVAMELTDSAKDIIQGGRCREYLAIERSGSNTRAFCPEAPDGVELANCALWSLPDFLDRVTATNRGHTHASV